MFKKKENPFANGGHTIFDHPLAIEGNVRFAGTLDIEGTVHGNVSAEKGADALVRVRTKGVVNGEIHAPKIIINGNVNGDVYCSKHLELAANAVVNGNVHYRVIEMVKGAEVNGNLVHMTEKAEAESASKSAPAKPESVKAAPQSVNAS